MVGNTFRAVSPCAFGDVLLVKKPCVNLAIPRAFVFDPRVHLERLHMPFEFHEPGSGNA